MPRQVPPVHSPLSPAALWRGATAACFRGVHVRALAEIDQWVRETFAPSAWAWLDSGTSALRLALELAVAGQRTRRIALPAYGCYDLATACDGAGVEAALYDMDPATLGPEWASLERALQGGVEAVVVVHQYGVPVDLDRVRALAGRYGAILIEDAAQGTGGRYAGRPLGSHGDLAILSFGRGKGLTAGGGGALLAHAESFATRVKEAGRRLGPPPRGLPALLKSVVQWALARPSLYWIPAGLPFLGLGETVYQPAHPAGALSRSSSGVLSRTIRLGEAAGAARRAAAGRWLSALTGLSALRLPAPPAGSEPGYLRFPVLAGPAVRRHLLGREGRREGLAPGYPGSLADLAGFRPQPVGESWLGSGSQVIARELVTLPAHFWANPGMVARLVRDVQGETAAGAPLAQG